MKRRLYFSVVAIVVLISVIFDISKIYSNAIENINFRNIGIKEGLSQATAEVIYQDSRGYIWIGTADGLNRYNGYEFKIYKYSEDSNNSITSNSIEDIAEDKNGDIWVTTSNGVNKIDKVTDKITNYTDYSQGGSLSNFNATEILITEENKIIVGTTNGLNIYDEKTDKFVRVLEKETDLTSQFIYSLGSDDEGNIWIGTSNGLDKISKEFKSIKQYNNDEENAISDSAIYNIICDKNGDMWIGTANSGLVKIDKKTEEIKQYKNKINDETSLCNNHIKEIFIDSNDVMWIGTNNGLAKHNKDDDSFYTYKNSSYDVNSLAHNTIFSITEDNSGLIWVGTESGISIFDSNNKIVHYKSEPFNDNSLSSNAVHGIYEDESDMLWIGTSSEGINLIDRTNNTVKHINKNHDEYGMSNYSINDITGMDNIIYVATNEGLNILDKDKKTCKTYFKEDGLESNHITTLFLDDKNYLWIGSNEGLNILDTKTYEIINISEVINKDSETSKYVKSIYQDKEGDYYIGFFRNGGMIKINPKDKSIISYVHDKDDKYSISNNYVRCITEDNDNNIWIGTSYGINKFDKKTEKFYRYTAKDGLSNDTVYGILTDKDNNLWISTNGGISKFYIEKNIFRNFGITEGLQSNEFNGNASYKSKSGDLIFGGINGLNMFDPDKFDKTTFAPSVVFEDFYVRGHKIYDMNNIELKSDDDVIKIEFFVPTYENTSKTTYYYTLEGNNTEWNSTNDNQVTYHKLSPGDYTFRIIARYSNGEYSDESKISFKIRPPLWASDIAIVLYIIIIFILIYNNNNKMKKLDGLINRKTKQLRDEMEKSNDLLNKVIKLERNKNNYFVNLSHELRTPLNVISSTNQLIEDLNRNDKGISREKISHYMDISNRNCTRLLKLINNIIDSTKLENDNYIINLKNQDIVYVVEEATLGLIDFAKRKGIDIIVDPHIEEKFIKCDAYEIERCIVNLVGNAIKFTPTGGTIEVIIEDYEDSVVISVKDNGIGIDEKHKEFIFDRFNQVIDSNNEVKGGSGLGLTITKQIIELHKGKIYVESEVGKGSKFVIELPSNN